MATEPETVSARALGAAGFNVQRFVKRMLGRKKLARARRRAVLPEISLSTQRVLEKAFLLSALNDDQTVRTEHVLVGILATSTPPLRKLLLDCGLQPSRLDRILHDLQKRTQEQGPNEKICPDCGKEHEVNDDKDVTALEYFGVELTKKKTAEALLPIVGREAELERLITVLNRKTKNNPLLLGEAGVGKTAIVEGLAKRIVEGNVPERLRKHRVYNLSMSSLLAGATLRGDLEGRLLDIIDDIADLAKKNVPVILFMDEFHTIGEAANILKPALARGELRLIGATTNAEYKKYIENDAALVRRMVPVTVSTPSADETLQILRTLSPVYAQHHTITGVADGVLEEVIALAARYAPTRHFPDKAIDLLDEAMSFAHGCALELVGVHQSAERLYAIPKNRLTSLHSASLATLEARLTQHIIGQDEAVATVTRLLKRARIGLSHPDRPLSTFLFAGPSGVGKTALAKTIAREFFADPEALLRLDMTEFSESHSISKLLGSPPGYVGYRETAKLTDFVKQHPHSVIVFDEFEKAHRDIQNILLQILEEGALTDAAGEVAHFRHAIVVLTTNAGRDLFTKTSIGFDSQTLANPDLRIALEEFFKPELLNRLDEVILFKKLTREHILAITKRELAGLERRMNDRKITVKLPQHAATRVAKNVNLAFGARDVRRVIEHEIEREVVEKYLQQV